LNFGQADERYRSVEGRRHELYLIEIMGVFFETVSSTGRDETVPGSTKPFFPVPAELRKQGRVIQPTTRTAVNAGIQTGDRQMRTLSFILAFAFVLAGPSIAGSLDSSLPGIGTFTYNGSPVATPEALVVAVR
jgi:hypothetical protein